MYSFCGLFFPSSVFEFAVMQGSITVTPFPGSGFLEAGSAPFAGFPPFAGFLPFTPSAFLPFAVPGAGAGLGWAGLGLGFLALALLGLPGLPALGGLPALHGPIHGLPCLRGLRLFAGSLPFADFLPFAASLVSFERFAPCSEIL